MRKVSFSWKPTVSGRESWRWGLFMVVPSRSGRSDRLRIMVRGLLLWLAGLAGAGYLLLTTVWYAMLERRPINYVTWVDCVMAPVRWEEIKRMRGEAFIAEGLIALENRRWSEARLKIEAGLTRAPHHWKGRRSLGLFYIAAGRRDLGVNLMMDGLRRHYPGRDAVELLLQLGVSGEDFASALQVVEIALELPGSAVARDRDWLIDQKCRLFMVAGQFELALAWIAEQEAMTDLRHESRTVALIELKRYDEARVALKEWGQGSGVLGGVRRIGVRLERETGNLEAMRKTLTEMRRRDPTSPQPWIYTVVQEHLAGEGVAAHEALQRFFMRFGTQAQNLVMAAQPLEEIEAWELFDEVMIFAAERGMDGPGLRRLRFEAAVARKDYAAAQSEVSASLMGQTEDLADREAAWWEVAAARLNHLATGEEASGRELILAIEQAPFRLGFAKKLAVELEEANRRETALRVWELTAWRYPASADAQEAIIRLRQEMSGREIAETPLPEIEDGVALNIEAVLPQSDELPDELAAAVQSARRFTAAVENLIEAQNWGELDRLLREVRRVRPNWLSAVSESLYHAEIELSIGDENWPALITNVRMRNDGSLDRALDTMKIARRLDDLGQRGLAEQVLQEIERRQPNFPPARRLREDWAAENESPDA